MISGQLRILILVGLSDSLSDFLLSLIKKRKYLACLGIEIGNADRLFNEKLCISLFQGAERIFILGT
jgi:hypothetical protein